MTSWSYQSESSTSFVVLDGVLSRIVSAPLPTSRTPELSQMVLRIWYVPGRILTVPPPRRATASTAAWIGFSPLPTMSPRSWPTVIVSRSSHFGSDLRSPEVARIVSDTGRECGCASADPRRIPDPRAAAVVPTNARRVTRRKDTAFSPLAGQNSSFSRQCSSDCSVRLCLRVTQSRRRGRCPCGICSERAKPETMRE